MDNEIRPGTLWKTGHSLFLPAGIKKRPRSFETILMVIKLEDRILHGTHSSMPTMLVEVHFLDAKGDVGCLNLLNGDGKTWMERFYGYCSPAKERKEI